MTNIVGVAPEAVTIGMAVTVRFEEFDDDVVLPLFAPARSDGSTERATVVDWRDAAGRRRAAGDGHRRHADAGRRRRRSRRATSCRCTTTATTPTSRARRTSS